MNISEYLASPTKRLAPLAAAVLCALSAQTAVAQEVADKEDNLDDVEVIAIVGKTTNTVITPQELEKYQANDLADVFRLVPSVSVGGSLGIAQKVYIRGLEDTLLNVTVDGAPQTSTLFHHMGRVSIDPELLREVEVQAGAGEATAGAGAVGGAIRFKTKGVDDLLDSSESFGGQLKGNYFSNDGYKGSATLYGRLGDDWGVLGSYVYSDRNNMKDGSGVEINGTGGEQKLGYFKLGGDITDSQSITFSYESRKEEGEFSQRPNWPALEGATLYPIELTRDTFVANYLFELNDAVNLDLSAYHTEAKVVQDVYDRWGKYQGKVTTYGFDLRNQSYVSNHTITYGVEHRKDEVHSKPLVDGGGDGAKEEGSVTAFYAQDHWQINRDLLLSFGLRYDKYDLEQITYDAKTDSDGFSPNIGVQYQISDNWRFNAGYAQAMRGKEVGDAFTVEAGYSSLDPNLKAEEVDNTEVAITYEDDSWQVTATGYKSDIDNVIQDQLGQGTYYENVGTLETKGFEVRAVYWFEDLRIMANYSNNDAEINGHTVEGYEHIGLANARGDTWGLNLKYTLTDDIEFGWNFTYVQDLNNIEVLHRAVDIGWIDRTYTIDKDGYQVHDVYAQWTPLSNDSLKVNLAVQNLFDEDYRDHSSVGDYSSIPDWGIVAGLKEAGRDIRASISYQF
ncbi:TonB-dependent receptor [Shewanella maritima]|uniref:TonB-dependent receptor n=1 Tax=Shewanella maritima TaxID=2520507 RepID=A0A411PI48_9GAMM|nr:TonB-dependent receptor [Shewanella maritima]QBF83281.1 TonB-dependent receptor [Shewanella maritima]